MFRGELKGWVSAEVAGLVRCLSESRRWESMTGDSRLIGYLRH